MKSHILPVADFDPQVNHCTLRAASTVIVFSDNAFISDLQSLGPRLTFIPYLILRQSLSVQMISAMIKLIQHFDNGNLFAQLGQENS